MTKHILVKIETGKGRKAGMYLYQIKDESGRILLSRTSNKEYVAANYEGNFFFSRLDLIGKGDHGKRISHCLNGTGRDENTGKYVAGMYPPKPEKAAAYKNIAYLEKL